MSYTLLYILVMVLSFLLMNSWIVLARFVQQIKLPPSDKDFDQLSHEKLVLEKNLDEKNLELMDLKSQIGELERRLSESKPKPSGN